VHSGYSGHLRIPIGNLYYPRAPGNPQPVLPSSARWGRRAQPYTGRARSSSGNPVDRRWRGTTICTPPTRNDWTRRRRRPDDVDFKTGGRPDGLAGVRRASRALTSCEARHGTGEHLLTSKFVGSLDWIEGIQREGQPAHILAKDASVPGNAGVGRTRAAATLAHRRVSAPTKRSPLFGTRQTWSRDVPDATPTAAAGWARGRRAQRRHVSQRAEAIDYKTGNVKWSGRTDSPWGPGARMRLVGAFFLIKAGGLPVSATTAASISAVMSGETAKSALATPSSQQEHGTLRRYLARRRRRFTLVGVAGDSWTRFASCSREQRSSLVIGIICMVVSPPSSRRCARDSRADFFAALALLSPLRCRYDADTLLRQCNRFRQLFANHCDPRYSCWPLR